MPDTDQYDSSVNSEQESLTQRQLQEMDDDAVAQKEKNKQFAAAQAKPNLPKFHKGGTVTKTGPAMLEKGEIVVPKNRASEYRKIFMKRGKEGKHKWGAND